MKNIVFGLVIVVGIALAVWGAITVRPFSEVVPPSKFTFFEAVRLNLGGTFYANCREGIVQRGWYISQKHGWVYRVLAVCENVHGVIVRTELELKESSLEKIK